MLSYYIRLYYIILSGAYSPRITAQPSFLPFRSPHLVHELILLSCSLHYTIKGQEHLPDTYSSHHANSNLSGQKAFCKLYSSLHNSLCYSDIENDLLNYDDASSLSGLEITNMSFAVSFHCGGNLRFQVFQRTPGHHSESRLWLPPVLHTDYRLEVLSRYLQAYRQKAQALQIYIRFAKVVPSYLHSPSSRLVKILQ